MNEIATEARVGILIDERTLPVIEDLRSACDLLGVDPAYVPNEGKLVAIVDASVASDVLTTMPEHERGNNAAMIGQVTASHVGCWQREPLWEIRGLFRRRLVNKIPRIC